MKPKIYFTSDWHIGHQNVLKFDERPFASLDEMHEALIRNFNKIVPKHGITYFLGDSGLCSHGLLKGVITRLNGIKVKVRGNHDGGMYSLYNAGFDVVTDKAQISIGKDIVTMTHCPLIGTFREDTTGMRNSDGTDNWHGESRHANHFSINDFGQYHLHGHIHARGINKNNKPVQTWNQFDVSVCGNNYKPVSLSAVEAWIQRSKKGELDWTKSLTKTIGMCDCGTPYNENGVCETYLKSVKS